VTIKGFRDMKKELEQRERNNPINMTDHDIHEELFNLGVQRTNNITAFTKEQEARSQKLFNESTHRYYEKTSGHRPTQTQKAPPPSTPPLTQQSELNETEKQATKVLKFAFGVIQPRKLKEGTK
jgi:hypothetical protein